MGGFCGLEGLYEFSLSKSHSKWPTLGFWEVRWYAWWRGPRCIRVLACVGLSWCSRGLPLVHLDYPICAWIREPWPLMSHRGAHLPSRPLVAVPLDGPRPLSRVSQVLSAVVVPPLYLFFLTPPLDGVLPGLVHQSMDKGARVFCCLSFGR